PQGSGGLNQPIGEAFGPDGNFYVCSYGTNQILRYDGTTGAFIDVFASGGVLNGPIFLTFHDSARIGSAQGLDGTSISTVGRRRPLTIVAELPVPRGMNLSSPIVQADDSTLVATAAGGFGATNQTRLQLDQRPTVTTVPDHSVLTQSCADVLPK